MCSLSQGTRSVGSWVNPCPGEIGSCWKQEAAAARGEGGAVLGSPGERSLLPAQFQGGGDRTSLTLPKPPGQWHRFFSVQLKTGSWGVITLGHFTPNPNILGSSLKEALGAGVAGSHHPVCSHAACLDTPNPSWGQGWGWSKPWSSPGTSTRHPRVSHLLPRVSRMCCTPGLPEAGKGLERVTRRDQGPTTLG